MRLNGTAAAEMDGKPLKTVLKQMFQLSTGQYKRAKFDGCILLNGERARVSEIVHGGDTVEVLWEERPIPEEVLARRTASARLWVPELKVLYEDEQLLVIDKPAPMPSVASPRQEGVTVEEMLLRHLNHPQGFVYRPVNRLDKGTSGLMLIAKTAWAQQRMQSMLHTECFQREYLAITQGVPFPEKGEITLPIGKEDGASIRRIVLSTDKGGRECKTLYTVEETDGARALVRLRLMTGRTHQIRVHLAATGCPVCGDFLYGTELGCLPGRFALHSASLRFIHPLTEKAVTLESPLPMELRALLNNIK